jgi:putative ABC transport system permease protein
MPIIKNVGNGSSFGIESFNKLTYKLQETETVFDDAQQLYLDGNALEIYDVKMILGSSVPDNANEGTRTTIINRTAAEKFAKVKNVSMDELIGTTVIREPEYTSQDGRVGFPFVITGIFEDINVFSLREKLEPYFITISAGVRMDGVSIISYNPDESQEVIAQITALHNRLDEPYPLELEFLSENMIDLYQQDRQTANLLFWLNIVAVILAILGIVGITLFLIIARTKEIGIRKVLGASEFAILKSTVREYVFFIGVALLISWPIAWFASNEWLSNFAYKIEIQHVIFIVIGMLTFLVTALIVGTVSLKAARVNPAKSLRSD